MGAQRSVSAGADAGGGRLRPQRPPGLHYSLRVAGGAARIPAGLPHSLALRGRSGSQSDFGGQGLPDGARPPERGRRQTLGAGGEPPRGVRAVDLRALQGSSHVKGYPVEGDRGALRRPKLALMLDPWPVESAWHLWEENLQKRSTFRAA